MLSQKVFKTVQTEWAAPIVFAPKKDGLLRFCGHCKKLNNLTCRDSYPLPRMDECIDLLWRSIVFGTLNTNSVYWQEEIDEEDRDETVFTSYHGLYHFVCMPCKLENDPRKFQQITDVIVALVKWQSVLVCLDDLAICLTTPE